MIDKEQQILEATLRVVAKYGIKKTTMADIASEAKISRQSLYNAFSNKEAVLQAAVKYIMDQDLNKVRAEWENLTEASEKLDCFFINGPVSWFDRIQAAPDAAEFIEGLNDFVQPSLEEAHIDWVFALKEMLSKKLDKEKAGELADFIFICAKNAKSSAENRSQLLKRLDLLKEMVVSTYLK